MHKSGQVPHRPGPLHQTNKIHKGSRHNRKSSATAEIKNKSNAKSKFNLRREERFNQASQVRKLKKEKTLESKRKLGFEDNSPLVVGVIDPYANITKPFISSLKEFSKDDNVFLKEINDRSIYVVCTRLKTRFKFVQLDTRNPNETLDLVKSLDLMIMLHKADHLIHDACFNCDELLDIIRIHCLPTTIHIVDDLDSSNKVTRKMIDAKRALKCMVESDRTHCLEKSQDFYQMFHLIGSCKRLSSRFKEARSTITTDRATIIDGSLALEGFVRHKTLSPNDLVHVLGYGDFQIKRIDVLSDVVSLRNMQSTTTPVAEDQQLIQTLVPDPAEQENLDQENEVDPMEAEQTWPTAEELAAEAEKRNTRKVIRKLPPGTSEYQGAWIHEDSDYEESEPESEEEMPLDRPDDDGQSGSEMSEDEADNDKKDYDTSAPQSDTVTGPAEMDLDEYDKNHSKEKEMKIHEKIKEARMNEMFPDEMDTPADIPARVRFARYRGLKSFRTSPWDPQENLPPDYSRIFQFQNFKQTRHRVMHEESREGASPGLYIRILLADVPVATSTNILSKTIPPSMVALLRYERKMTVMNFLIKRVPGSDQTNPVKSKDELEFHVGFRRFMARPLFTTHNVANKFKYERFLRDDVAMVATVYAPITFPPVPVLVFRDGELVASGSVLDSNPNRIIIKRIKLSGHPYKIHSKTAVLRFMFFNSEDVLYFKPVELVTRYNRRGHISEPLGTHGHMKCTFDRKIRSDDCVFMNLYKRVFSKWTYSPLHYGEV